jgi:hypothetical protein
MKKMFLFFWILFLSILPLGCFGQNQPSKIDKIEDSKATDHFSWDFGQVEQGKILQHTFILKNESDKTLNIKDINTSCGCTVSKVEKKTLSPGESTSIDVRFNSKGYSGPLQQFIYVNTDSLDNPILKYTIKTNVAK